MGFDKGYNEHDIKIILTRSVIVLNPGHHFVACLDCEKKIGELWILTLRSQKLLRWLK